MAKARRHNTYFLGYSAKALASRTDNVAHGTPHPPPSPRAVLSHTFGLYVSTFGVVQVCVNRVVPA